MAINLRAIDLNLLVILDALLQEGSVSAAARRIPLSQPATSLALQRLRTLLGDPLLVRSGARMLPTPQAQALREPVARILSEIADTLQPESFAPATSERIFRIHATDHIELSLLPEVLQRLAREAPRARLASYSMDGGTLRSETVRKGETDLVLGYLRDPPEGFHRKTLFQERFVCIARKRHPALRQGLSLEAFVSARHLLASPQGGNFSGPVDEALAKLRRRRFVAASVPRFAVIPGLVASSDLLATLPARIATRREWRNQIDVFELPLAVPGFAVSMLWHARQHQSPAHVWFRKLVAVCAANSADT
ncbi:MAG: LysR family transcriptional regulator [Betaproteobacteria bacterium]|nr:LysR family transcriptional regulator [Betaproteobacteria bacterium]